MILSCFLPAKNVPPAEPSMNDQKYTFLLVCLIGVCPCSAAVPSLQAADAHPIVPGFERFHATGADAARGGRLLLSELNCVSCHQPDAGREAARKQAPVLDRVGQRVRRSYLRKFLRDPQAMKPGTTMPNLLAGIPEGERGPKVEALTHFLASTGSLRPDRPDRKAIAAGRALFHQVGCVACHGTRDEAGHAAKVLSSSVPLGDLPAKHSLAGLAAFLENPHASRPSGRMPGILNNAEAKQVANYLLQGATLRDDDDFPIQPALVEKGRELFASLGCASCHQMSIGGKTIASTFKATPLSKLHATGGCLSKEPAAGLPRYALNAVQQSALTAAIQTPPPSAKPGPAEVIAQAMTTFNCYACHQRDNVGGIEDALSTSFITTQPEMGEEGRVPPALNDVGVKLRLDYVKHIFNQGAHDRPYMLTRMPRFGENNLPGLAEAFAALDKDKVAPVAAVHFTEPAARIKAEARQMVGALSLGCVKCHTFAGHKAEGVQGIDMLLMPRRLQHDWFYRYLLDPQKLRPGTRMPTAWTNGMTVLPDVLGGSTPKQIESIWLYLQEGGKAALPVGIHKHFIPLNPDKEAILYRNFLQGSGTRGIGVGYPEKAHLAFDANDLRLAMIWQGAFIDAARHWTDRGAGSEGPLGDNVIHFPTGVAFAVLSGDAEAWPTRSAKELGYKFRGYHTTPDSRPTFVYTGPGVRIEDFPNAVQSKPNPSIRRTLTLTADDKSEAPARANLYFRAAVADKIEPAGDKGVYRINGEWTLKIESAAAPKIRKSGGKMELLVPVRFHDGAARIVEEFVW